MKSNYLRTIVTALATCVWYTAALLVEPDQGNLRATNGNNHQLITTGSSMNSLNALPDVWIVEFHASVKDVVALANKLATLFGGKVGFVYEYAFKGFAFRGPNVYFELSDHPFVVSVSRDSISNIAGQTIPRGIQRIYADRNLERTGRRCVCDAVIAVIDTGIEFDHPDLNVNKQMSVDCTSGFSYPQCARGGGNDDNGHGTHVAGSASAIDNNQGVVGVCPGAELWAIKVLNAQGSGYRSWILAGLDYVISSANKVDVINMSLGGPGCDSTYCNALSQAKSVGIAIAVAAGNDNRPANGYSPACCSSVLTVSALSDSDGRPGGNGPRTCRGNLDDVIAQFSNYGNAVDIAAPGDCIFSTFIGKRYATLSGTSMASPHVAGALAILASNNHNGDVQAMYDTLIVNGNKNFRDKPGDADKEPLLDVRNIPDPQLTGICPSIAPSLVDSEAPSPMIETDLPSATSSPSDVTNVPSAVTNAPSLSSPSASPEPVQKPSVGPSSETPENAPSLAPTIKPEVLTSEPTTQTKVEVLAPTGSLEEVMPSFLPKETLSDEPSLFPVQAPSDAPSLSPAEVSIEVHSPSPTEALSPSPSPTEGPSLSPIEVPSDTPSLSPTVSVEMMSVLSPSPSVAPSAFPTKAPSPSPTEAPSPSPTELPSPSPTEAPSPSPTERPTLGPTEAPSSSPTERPTLVPTKAPSPAPTERPTLAPTEAPSPPPTERPTLAPTESPSPSPTEKPTSAPTEAPSPSPTKIPTLAPTEAPSPPPTERPSLPVKSSLPSVMSDMLVEIPCISANKSCGSIGLSCCGGLSCRLGITLQGRTCVAD